MKSNDEEYLDSLLNSARQSNNNNPGSALSRMSGRGSSGSAASNGPGDVGMLVNNSGGNNEDLNDIGNILDRLDRNMLVDEDMADLLDDIERPTSSAVPKFTVGGAPSARDVRDPEEIALDEAIADAERLDAEIQSGKFDKASSDAAEPEGEVPVTPEMPQIVDLEEGDDALLEMAPEVSLPEENVSIPESIQDTDADQTPEEILTDLLDDMPDKDLMPATEESVQDSLSYVLDNMKEEEAADGSSEQPESVDEEKTLDNLELDELDNLMADEAPNDAIPAEESSNEPAAEGSDGDNLDLDDFPLDDLEAAMDSAIGENTAAEATGEAPSDAAEAETQEEFLPHELMMDDGSVADSANDEGGGDSPNEPDATQEPASSESAAPSLDELSEDEFNLDALEASLDDLLTTDGGDAASTEGEVAALADTPETPAEESTESDGEEVDMQDLDALMNSLANDDIEDLESTAQKDEEAGHAEEEELPKEDILGALTEDAFGDMGADPSLEELASIPEKRGSGGGGGGAGADSDEESEEGGKKKKKKKEGFFARLFKALTREDEEPANEGLASLTDENQQVLNELGEEGGKKAKKKKEKKEKKPKEKKPKKEKPPKEKKPPKPKKEKKPKPPKDPEAPEPAISPKKVALSFIFAASLGILVCIPAFILPDRIASQRANNAFEQKEYTTAYKMLYGKEMSEEESLIYEQSRVQAWAMRYLDGYNNYTAMNMKEEALDMLLMAMRNKADLLAEAEKYNVVFDVDKVYSDIELLLSDSYGLSADDVAEINSIKKDRDYTIRLMEIVGTIES